MMLITTIGSLPSLTLAVLSNFVRNDSRLPIGHADVRVCEHIRDFFNQMNGAYRGEILLFQSHAVAQCR